VAGRNPEDYAAVCRRLDEIECVSILELNVSCPNVSDGLDYGAHPDRLEPLVAHVRGHVKRAKLMVKLSPNVTDIAAMARAAVNGGAEVLSLINTLQGMVINVETFKPMLANVVGGLSGPAIKPVAVHMVHRVYCEVACDAGVPIVGMGGIQNWRDAVEFFLAGATAVAVGTILFVDPTVPNRICEGLTEYLTQKKLTSIRELVGRVQA
jgi:dihydroorotate dehydrogenase (NAD+) catalytic subunit